MNQPLFVKEITSDQEGFIESFDTTMIGWANVDMGCGRRTNLILLIILLALNSMLKLEIVLKKGIVFFVALIQI